MAWTVIGAIGTRAAAGGTSTGTLNTLGSDLIVVMVCALGGTTNPPTDTYGNRWRPRTNLAVGSPSVRIFYTTAYDGSFTTGPGHSFQSSVLDSNGAIFVLAASGSVIWRDPFDFEAAGGYKAGSSTVQPGFIYPTLDDSFIIAGLGDSTSTAWSINSGFILDLTISSGAGCIGGALFHLEQSPNAGVNPTLAGIPGSELTTVMASFQPMRARGFSPPDDGYFSSALIIGG